MQSRIRLAVGAVAVVVSAGGAATAAQLLPATLSIASATLTDVTPVRWRGGSAGLAAGLATAIIIGGLLAAPRSFDPISGTYRGHHGRRHYCQ